MEAVPLPLTGTKSAPGSMLRTFGEFTSIRLRAHLPILQTRELRSGSGRGKSEFEIQAPAGANKPEGSLNFVAMLYGKPNIMDSVV